MPATALRTFEEFASGDRVSAKSAISNHDYRFLKLQDVFDDAVGKLAFRGRV
jgi:hypothetical protein